MKVTKFPETVVSIHRDVPNQPIEQPADKLNRTHYCPIIDLDVLINSTSDVLAMAYILYHLAGKSGELCAPLLHISDCLEYRCEQLRTIIDKFGCYAGETDTT